MIAKARKRAAKPPTAEELKAAARRAGAPVAARSVDRAARELIAELGKGRRLDPTLGHLLVDLLRRQGIDRPRPVGDSARSAAAWIDATPEERGRTLVDLLLVADAIPLRPGPKGALEFPRLDSGAG